MISQLISKIEAYNFECDAGNLRQCTDWQKLKVELAAMQIERDQQTNGIPEPAALNDGLEAIWPSQCSCGHLYLEKYQFAELQNGFIGFAWCGFCRTRFNVKPYTPNIK